MKKNISVLFASIVLLISPVVVLALNSVEQIINNIMNLIVWPLFIGAVVIMSIWAGFLFVTAQGDPSKIATAKKAVLWAIIGAIVGIAAFSVTEYLSFILGV